MELTSYFEEYPRLLKLTLIWVQKNVIYEGKKKKQVIYASSK